MRTYPGDTRSPHLDPLSPAQTKAQGPLAPHPKLICTPKRASSTLSPQKISDLSQVVSSLLPLSDHGRCRLTPRYRYSQRSRPRSGRVGRALRTSPLDLRRRSLRIACRAACCAVCSESESAFAILGSAIMLYDMMFGTGQCCHRCPRRLIEDCTRKDLPPSCHCRY